MTKYLYIIQRNSLYQKPIRELLCTDKYITINNIEINDINKIGVKLAHEKEHLIQFLSIIREDSLENFQTALTKICNEKGLSCKYSYNGKQYLILPKPKEKMGVWKEGGVIIHQVGINTINRESEIIALRDKPKGELKKFNDEVYYSLWDELYKELLKRFPLYPALSLSFVLAYNKYYNDINQIKYQYQLPYYLLGWRPYKGIEQLGCAAALTPEQFKFYIEPALTGSLMAINPFGQVYSPFNARQMNRALEFYVHDFYQWKLNK